MTSMGRSVAFGGTAELAPDETLKYIAYAETANPNFPGDYCDFCNCSIPRKSGCGPDPDCARIAFGVPEMAASQDAGADANAGAEDFSGTNNQVHNFARPVVHAQLRWFLFLHRPHNPWPVCAL